LIFDLIYNAVAKSNKPTLLKKRHFKATMFENRVLRRIFGPKRDEVSGEWRRLHNEELNDLY
jgi:hypothetical protein